MTLFMLPPLLLHVPSGMFTSDVPPRGDVDSPHRLSYLQVELRNPVKNLSGPRLPSLTISRMVV